MADEAAQVRSRIRRFRRAASPALPFVPWGLLPLLGLLLLLGGAWPTAQWLETRVRASAQQALREAGKDWVSVEVSGQWVTVSGTPPSPEAAQGVEALVSAASAPTWLGPRAPVTYVTSRFEQPPVCAPAPAPEPEPPGWSFRLLAGELELTGALPDEATRQQIEAAAQALVQPPRLRAVSSELLTSGLPFSEADLQLALRGVETVGRCDSGEASLKAGVFSLRCELARQVEPSVRERATAALPDGTLSSGQAPQLGEIVLLVTEEIASCESALAELLQSATIEFETRSAEIGASSQPLLDRVAEQAKSCPGTLRVEGHTDSQGTGEYNLALSQRRAESVRAALVQRGLPEDRLVARGFGEERPIADNATAEGRAHNRRIEIKVVRSHE